MTTTKTRSLIHAKRQFKLAALWIGIEHMADDGMPDFARITQGGQESWVSPLDLFFYHTTLRGFFTFQPSLYQKDPLMKSLTKAKGPAQWVQQFWYMGMVGLNHLIIPKISPNTFCTYLLQHSFLSLVLWWIWSDKVGTPSNLHWNEGANKPNIIYKQKC